MLRSAFSGIAVATVVMLTAVAPAHAQNFGKRGGGYIGHSKSFSAIKRHRVRRARPRVRDYYGEDRLPSPATAASIYALGVYLQWRECLDNLLPECP